MNLWAKLETEIRNQATSNKDDLKKALREECERIGPELKKKVVQSTPDCLKEVTINSGLQTRLGMRD